MWLWPVAPEIGEYGAWVDLGLGEQSLAADVAPEPGPVHVDVLVLRNVRHEGVHELAAPVGGEPEFTDTLAQMLLR